MWLYPSFLKQLIQKGLGIMPTQFKAGQQVRIAKKIVKSGLGSWCKEMNPAVGKSGIITQTRSDGDGWAYRIDVPAVTARSQGNGYFYWEECLEDDSDNPDQLMVDFNITEKKPIYGKFSGKTLAAKDQINFGVEKEIWHQVQGLTGQPLPKGVEARQWLRDDTVDTPNKVYKFDPKEAGWIYFDSNTPHVVIPNSTDVLITGNPRDGEWEYADLDSEPTSKLVKGKLYRCPVNVEHVPYRAWKPKAGETRPVGLLYRPIEKDRYWMATKAVGKQVTAKDTREWEYKIPK